MTVERLPIATKTEPGRGPLRCPWCGYAVEDDAMVKLIDLIDAHLSDELRYAKRDDRGGAEGGCRVECAGCGKETLLVLATRRVQVDQGDDPYERQVRLVPFRTDADLRLIEEGRHRHDNI